MNMGVNKLYWNRIKSSTIIMKIHLPQQNCEVGARSGHSGAWRVRTGPTDREGGTAKDKARRTLPGARCTIRHPATQPTLTHRSKESSESFRLPSMLMWWSAGFKHLLLLAAKFAM